MSGIDVFLSYSREDRAAVRHIAESFEAEGINVWWDAALKSGQTFDEVIEQRLKEAKAVVVLWSPRSVASRWVRAEATLADRKNKLVPAIIEPCDRPIAFELTHTADLSEWTGDTADARWRAFVKDVRRLVDSRAGTRGRTAKPARPRAPERRAAPPPPVAASGWSRATTRSSLPPRSARRARSRPERERCRPAERRSRQRHDEFHCLRISDGVGRRRDCSWSAQRA